MILIVLTYLAGVLTILSPCILPVLPFVFSRSQKSFTKSGLPLLLGMCLTFTFFSALAVVGGEWISHASEIGRYVAIVILTILGLSLLFPEFSERLLAPLTRLGSKIGSGSSNEESVGSSVLIGISTGLLWAPCAGPILGLVLTGAAAQGKTATSLWLLLSYSLGAATSLALALVAGNRFLGTLKKFLKADQIVKKTLGVLVLLGVAVIALHLDRTVLTQLSKLETASLESRLLSWAKMDHQEEEGPRIVDLANLPNEGEMPSLEGAVSWLNSEPLSRESLRGKVVIVDFWTYSCINCLRSLPYIKAWAEKFKNDDLVIIGVHTPEFAFEKNPDNVKKAVEDLNIHYPIAIDSDYKIWNAFQNEYWPAHYFIDREGRIRHHHFGEGEYDESEKVIRELLGENGKKVLAQEGTVKAEGVEAEGSSYLYESPETYVGYGRAAHLKVSPPIKPDQTQIYRAQKDLSRDDWSLDGSWMVSRERAVSQAPQARIYFQFYARDLHLVLGAASKVRFKVRLDGEIPGPHHGLDINEKGEGVIDSHRLYQLIRMNKDSKGHEHLFEIEFLDPGAEAYAFTFG